MRIAHLAGAALAAVAVFVSTASADAAEVIKIGTNAPAASPWGQVLKTWATAVSNKSGGGIELQFFFNGSAGDEGAVATKIKAGQLDGACTTSVGLSKFYKPTLALEMPGVFTSWTKLDAARDALGSEFDKGLRDGGAVNLGWVDFGAAHVFSKGHVVKVPTDLASAKPWAGRDDAIAPMFFKSIGGVTPVPLNLPEVLPQLNTGAINVFEASPLFAEQLQWTSKADAVLDLVTHYEVGAIVLSSKRFDALPEDTRNILTDTGKVAAKAMKTRIRSEDATAWQHVKGKMTVTTPSADGVSKWQAVWKKTRQFLAKGTFDAALVAKVETLGK